MLLIRNNAVLTTPLAMTATATRIPFDTVVLNTNGNLALDDSQVLEKKPGLYESICQVTVANASSSAAATVTLQAYADGNPIPGATATASVAASSSAVIALPWAEKVVAAENGVARIAWYLSGGAVNLANAVASVKRII